LRLRTVDSWQRTADGGGPAANRSELRAERSDYAAGRIPSLPRRPDTGKRSTAELPDKGRAPSSAGQEEVLRMTRLKRFTPALLAMLLAGGLLAAACSSNNGTTPNNTNAAAKQANNSINAAATQVKQAANAAATQVSQAVSAASTQVSQAANAASTQVNSAATQAGSAQANSQSANGAWSSLYTDAQNLINQLQTQNAPQAKQTAVSQCQSAVQQVQSSNPSLGSQVSSLCDKISSTDVSNSQAWNQIKQQLSDLNKQITGS
jgi:hypothetical protein